MQNVKNIAVTAAFFMDGIHEFGFNRVIEAAAGRMGCIEWVEELCSYAEYTCRLAQAGGEALGDFPGVFDYEVSTYFGKWFGEQLEALGDVPTKAQCRTWILNDVEKFFSQGGALIDSDKEKLAVALINTPVED